MILYKYRSNSEFTDKIFTDKKIWLSTAEGLNDPFECTIQSIAKDWIERTVKDLKNGHLTGFVTSAIEAIKDKTYFYDLDPKQTKEFLKKFRSKDFDSQYKTVREFIFRKTNVEISNPEDTFKNFDKQLNDVGIFSLSETDVNQLMWAHYADSSKGIAIGFEVQDGCKLANKEHCLKVNYSDELPSFKGDGFKNQIDFYADGKNIQKVSFNDSTFQLAISTKPTCWEYEREWRYIEEQSGSFNFPGKLREVVFGMKCSKEMRNHYSNLIKKSFDYKINAYEIVTIPDSNKIIKRLALDC